jgi:integrase
MDYWSVAGCVGDDAVSAFPVIWPDDEETTGGNREPIAAEDLRWDGVRKVPLDMPAADARMRLSEYVVRRFVPLHMVADKRTDKTILGYFDALRHAVSVAGDPLLTDVNAEWVARVKSGLEGCQFKRGKFGKPRTISGATREKHLRQLRAVVKSLGPDGEGVLDRPPRVRFEKAARRPKGCYTVDELRALVKAGEATAAAGLPDHFWRLCYGVLFYSGLRREAALSTRMSHLRWDGDAAWFDVDGHLNRKTGKPLWMPVHGALCELLRESRRMELFESRLIPWPHSGDWLLHVHKRLCAEAGVAAREDRPLDLHGVRRSLLTTAAFGAIRKAYECAAAFGQHSDVSITSESYVSLASLFEVAVPALPRLW